MGNLRAQASKHSVPAKQEVKPSLSNARQSLSGLSENHLTKSIANSHDKPVEGSSPSGFFDFGSSSVFPKSKTFLRLNSRALPIQAKLKIGQPNDKYEQEADRVAEQVMRMPEPELQQSSQADTNHGGIKSGFSASNAGVDVQRQQEKEEELIQAKPLAQQISPLIQRQASEEDDEELIQAKSTGEVTPAVTPAINTGIQLLRGGGQPLSQTERGFFEPRFGADFSQVRVHSDSRAAGLARSVNARAFTHGRDVVFGVGEYSSGSLGGRRLLAHELTHVVQQNNRPQANVIYRKPSNKTETQQANATISIPFRSNLRKSYRRWIQIRFSVNKSVAKQIMAESKNDFEDANHQYTDSQGNIISLQKFKQQSERVIQVPAEVKLQIELAHARLLARTNFGDLDKVLDDIEATPDPLIPAQKMSWPSWAPKAFIAAVESDNFESISDKRISAWSSTEVGDGVYLFSGTSEPYGRSFMSIKHFNSRLTRIEMFQEYPSDITFYRDFVDTDSAADILFETFTEFNRDLHYFVTEKGSSISGARQKIKEINREVFKLTIEGVQMIFEGAFASASLAKADLDFDPQQKSKNFKDKSLAKTSPETGPTAPKVVKPKVVKRAPPHSPQRLKPNSKIDEGIVPEPPTPSSKRTPQHTPAKSPPKSTQKGSHAPKQVLPKKVPPVQRPNAQANASPNGSSANSSAAKNNNDAPSLSNNKPGTANTPEPVHFIRRIESSEDFVKRYPGRIEFRRNGEVDFDMAFGNRTKNQQNVRGARGELIESLRLLENGHPVHGAVEKIIVLPGNKGTKKLPIRTPDFAVKYKNSPDLKRVEVTSKTADRLANTDSIAASMNAKGTLKKGTRPESQLGAPLDINEGAVLPGDTLVINLFKGAEPNAIANAVAKKGPEMIDEIKFLQFNRPSKTTAGKKPSIESLETVTYARDKNGQFKMLDAKHVNE